MSNLYRGPSIDASYQVSEEKIKMRKFNGQQTTSDDKSSHCIKRKYINKSPQTMNQPFYN